MKDMGNYNEFKQEKTTQMANDLVKVITKISLADLMQISRPTLNRKLSGRVVWKNAECALVKKMWINLIKVVDHEVIK